MATLAVGTEITDGQISDRNSQWLSSRAGELGYQVLENRAVPDDRTVILRSLTDLCSRARLVFVTGGLGPTTDDFTRECVAEFAGEPLEWHEPSWLSILERLKLRGATATENQKQQCFYPRGAVIFKNSNGTANGFSIKLRNGTRLVSLPGPPSEIEGIWNDGLRASLVLTGTVEKRELTILRTMGLGEGALASRVEEVIDDATRAFGGEIARPAVGYRATAPYVEIKLWASAQQAKVVAQIAAAIRHEFNDILVNEGAQDVADAVLAAIATEGAAGIHTVLVDQVTRGEIFVRLFNRAKALRDTSLIEALEKNLQGVVGASATGDSSLPSSSDTTVLQLKFGTHDLELRVGRGAREKQIVLPKLAATVKSDRGRKWAIETALREWGKL